MSNEKTKISIGTTVNATVEKVWNFWTAPEHIVKWNSASEDWHTPRAENDLRKGGRFLSRMEAKDGSAGFDFEGIYDDVRRNELISYTMSDGRKVNVTFEANGNQTKVKTVFEAEDTNPVEMQKQGWQSILDNFKKYIEEI